MTYQIDQNSGASLLLLPPPQESARPVLALALCPDSEPWFLLERAVDWAQKVDAQLDLCAVLSPGDPWGVFECSWQGIQQQLHQTIKVKRWLETLREAIPAHHRGAVTVLKGGVVKELAAHVKDHSVLLVGRSDRRRWWAPLRAPVADQIAHRSTTPVLVIAGRRPRREVVIHMPTPPADDLHTLRWVARYLPQSRVVVPRGCSAVLPRPRSTPRRQGKGQQPAAGLLPSKRQGQADLVVVPASRSLGIRQLLKKSQTRAVIDNSACSVLVVPESWAA